MALADVLSGIGRGIEGGIHGVGTGLKAAGAVLEPVAKRTADVLSGEAPQIDAEKRMQQAALDTAGIESQANMIETRLRMGGLKPDQSNQLIDQLSSLYSHPSQAPTLMQRLNRIVHGDKGATYSPNAPARADLGGIFSSQDEAVRSQKQADALELANAKMRTNYQPYMYNGSVINVDLNREEPPSGAVPVQKDSLVKHFQSKPVLSPSHGKDPIQASFDPGTGKYFDSGGKEITDATLYVKPSGAANIQYASLYAKDLLARQGKGEQLTPEESAQLAGLRSAMTIAGVARANAMAEASAKYGLVQAQDPLTGADIWVPKMSVLAAAQGGNPNLASKNSQRAMLAASALQQISTIKELIDAHPDLVGPVSGRKNAIERLGGVSSPEFARFQAAALYLAEHGSGVFGSRNIQTVNDLEKTITDSNLNADAVKAALDQSEKTNKMFLNPQAAQIPNTEAKQVGKLKDAMTPANPVKAEQWERDPITHKLVKKEQK